MFKNVLVGVDGRPNGRDAIALASRLTDPDGKLTLAHVHSGDLRASHAISPDLVRAEREYSKKLLEDERAAASVERGATQHRVRSPGRGLHQQAEDQNADLLVVGSCSHGAFGRAMLGDDTRAALNGAPCAVAIASRGYADGAGPQSPRSESRTTTRRRARRRLRARPRARGTHRCNRSCAGSRLDPDLRVHRDHAPRDWRDYRGDDPGGKRPHEELADVQGRAVYGLAGEELAAFGDQVDILVAGSRGYGPVKRLVLGSTTDYLQRHARCSLLVLPRIAVSSGEDSIS